MCKSEVSCPVAAVARRKHFGAVLGFGAGGNATWDTLGRSGGDEVLRSVVGLCSASVLSPATCGHYARGWGPPAGTLHVEIRGECTVMEYVAWRGRLASAGRVRSCGSVARNDGM